MINADVLKILNDQNNNFIAKIRQNLASTKTDATMESSKSLRYEITEQGTTLKNTIYAKPYFAVVETGRKPTPDKKPSRDMINNISKWVEVRGKPENMVWAIAVSIQKKGTNLFRSGGRTDIYSDLIPGYVDTILTEVTKSMADTLFKNTIASLK